MITIEIGYTTYVLPRDEAITLMRILEKAEVYEAKYVSKEERSSMGLPETSEYLYHVYPNERAFPMKLISDDLYRMAKLAGRPEK